MKRLKYILSLIIVVSSVLVSCDKYNTDVMGEDFAPYNSIVTRYRQLVYVEYQQGSAKVWGPYADKVEWDVEGSDVSIVSNLDSLVVISYGNAMGDDEKPLEGSLTIDSSDSYALYLTGLSLKGSRTEAIYSKSEVPCYLVLTDKAKNNIQGSFVSNGSIALIGRGSIDIKSQGDALVAHRGFVCSSEVKANIESATGDGVHAEQNAVTFADGVWTIKAERHAICNTDGPIELNGGTIAASARTGSFAYSSQGVAAIQSTCTGFASEPSELGDVQRQFIWQLQVDTLEVAAKEPVTINITPNTSQVSTKLATITPEFDYKTPWVFITHPSLGVSDWISISK